MRKRDELVKKGQRERAKTKKYADAAYAVVEKLDDSGALRTRLPITTDRDKFLFCVRRDVKNILKKMLVVCFMVALAGCQTVRDCKPGCAKGPVHVGACQAL